LTPQPTDGVRACDAKKITTTPNKCERFIGLVRIDFDFIFFLSLSLFEHWFILIYAKQQTVLVIACCLCWHCVALRWLCVLGCLSFPCSHNFGF
jgi:hypothetical protein